MFSKIYSAGIQGVDGYLVEVEADASDGLPGFSMVGYLSPEVKEAQDRVRTALKNSGIRLASKKITINLSPGDVRKEGTAYDLPVAVAVLSAFGIVDGSCLDNSILVGELGLDGEVKPIRGALSIVSSAKEAGMGRCFLPMENVREGTIVQGIQVVGVSHVRELVWMLHNPDQIKPSPPGQWLPEDHPGCPMDYGEVKGQLLLKRATEVAVAGMHNLLFIGPAGTGKTMVAQRIPTIMPSLSLEEQIQISKVYSICGMLSPDRPLLSQRPFRCPHHTISPQAMAGGGRIPKPGEISLASKGVLFLDEFPEFQKSAIEVLRQPLEEEKITISRVSGSYEYPAQVMLVASMNPCGCGFYPDPNKCRCTLPQIRRYLNKISKPLLDRIDICAEAAPVTYEQIRGEGQGESSAQIRSRVEKAREIQKKRFGGGEMLFNSRMKGRDISEFCRLQEEGEAFLKKAFLGLELNARAYGKILKVARTVADLEGQEEIGKRHLAEAIGFRSLEEKYWGGVQVAH